jgi:hypothetical protein
MGIEVTATKGGDHITPKKTMKKRKKKMIISDSDVVYDNKLTVATTSFLSYISILLCAHDDRKLIK